MGVEGIPLASADRYALYLLNSILGAGVSSRLFQEIREKRGLAYSIYSFMASYADTGMWSVYAGTARKRVGEVIELIAEEMNGLRNTITDTELQRAKDQMKGNLIMGLESTSSRMQNIARQEIYYGRYYSPEQTLKEIDIVSLDQVRGLAEKLVARGGMALTVLGHVEHSQVSQLRL